MVPTTYGEEGGLRTSPWSEERSGAVVGEGGRGLQSVKVFPSANLAPPRAQILLAGHFTTKLQKAYAERGWLALQCDYRPSADPTAGPHTQGDVRQLLRQPWKMIIASMPCKNIADSSTTERREKLADGRAWYGMTLCLLLLCADCDGMALELPKSMLDYYLEWTFNIQLVDLWWFGDAWTKPTVLRSRNLPALVATNALQLPPGASRWPSFPQSIIERDADAREQRRAAFLGGISAAIAEQWTPETICDDRAPPRFERLRQQVAASFTAEGHTLPADWDNNEALPPDGDEAFAIANSARTGRSSATAR